MESIRKSGDKGELRALAQRIKDRDDFIRKFKGGAHRLFANEVPVVIDALLKVAELEP